MPFRSLARILGSGFLVLGFLSVPATSASAASVTWDGEAGTSDLGTAANWTTDTLPAATGDTAVWNGTVAGDLALDLSSTALAGAFTNIGMYLSVTATQTSALTINASVANSIRMATLTVAAGAGPVSFGTSGAALTLNLGGNNGERHDNVNDSSNPVVFGPSLRWNLGGGGTHHIFFEGSGDWIFNSALTPAGGGNPVYYFIGTGTKTLNGANATFSNNGVFIGGYNSVAESGVVRVAATQALSTSFIDIGNGGNGNSGRLELIGGISMNNAITLYGRNIDATGIQNISENNTLSGTISASTGGSNFYIQSDSGLLTLSGATALTSLTVPLTGDARTFTLRGAGEGLVSGAITNGVAKTGIIKDGTGTWTFSGLNTYTGNTAVNAGTLALTTTGQMTFAIGASGVNTQLLGNGSGTAVVTLDGTFVFNLTGAGTTAGDSWTIIDYASLPAVIFGGTFSVSGFHSNDGATWTSNDGLYEFNQYSGVLTAVPEPGTFVLLTGGLAALLIFRRRRRSV